jgi:hypothetical protein
VKRVRYLTFKVERKKVIAPSANALFIFNQLKTAFAPFKSYFKIVSDTSDEFEAITKEVIKVRKGSFTTTNTHISFIYITLYKDYVKLQFHPFHLENSLVGLMPPELLRFKKSVNTFKFKTMDRQLLQSLDLLFRIGVESYMKQKFIIGLALNMPPLQ